MIINNSNINSIKDLTDFWDYKIRVNVIPADIKNKQTPENFSSFEEVAKDKGQVFISEQEIEGIVNRIIDQRLRLSNNNKNDN